MAISFCVQVRKPTCRLSLICGQRWVLEWEASEEETDWRKHWGTGFVLVGSNMGEQAAVGSPRSAAWEIAVLEEPQHSKLTESNLVIPSLTN